MFLKWKKAILVILLICWSKHSWGSNKTPRFLTDALCGMAKPSNHRETSSNFSRSRFEPIIISSVFPELSCRKFCDIQPFTAAKQDSTFWIWAESPGWWFEPVVVAENGLRGQYSRFKMLYLSRGKLLCNVCTWLNTWIGLNLVVIWMFVFLQNGLCEQHPSCILNVLQEFSLTSTKLKDNLWNAPNM